MGGVWVNVYDEDIDALQDEVETGEKSVIWHRKC